MKNSLTFILCVLPSFLWSQNIDGEKAWMLLDHVSRSYGSALEFKGKIKKVIDEELHQSLFKEVAEIGEILGRTHVSPKDFIKAFENKAKPEELEKLISHLKIGTAEAFSLSQFPENKPDIALGEKLYRDTCTNCHGGLEKKPSKELLATMKKKPPEFAVLASSLDKLSPYAVYKILSEKPKNKTMPDFSPLPMEQRWALAMYLFSLPPSESSKEFKLKTKLNWQSQMALSNSELREEAPVNPWMFRKTLLSLP